LELSLAYKNKVDHCANSVQWNKNNPEKRKAITKKYDLKRLYNITVEEYDKIYSLQGGCCAICGVHQKDLKYRLHVDHNHTTGQVRGLLCRMCNTLLGNCKEDIITLQAASNYINYWS